MDFANTDMRVFLLLVLSFFAVIFVMLAVVSVSSAVDAALGTSRIEGITNVRITATPTEEIAGYYAVPDGTSPKASLILVHDFFGLNRDITGFADALAGEGYAALAPDLFRGRTTSWLPRAYILVMNTADARINQDLDAAHSWLKNQSPTARIGILGFAYGAEKALLYSIETGNPIVTCLFYGLTLRVPGQAKKLKGSLFAAYAEKDMSVPLSRILAFRSLLEESEIEHTINVYEKVDHGFLSRIEQIEEEGAAAQAWSDFISFLGRHFAKNMSGGAFP